MQFSDTTNKQGIVEDITFLLGGVGTSEYSLADRTRNVNERFRQILTIIFESYGGWMFIDDNISSSQTTGVPYADSNLVSGTELYGLPSGALTVSEVTILNSGGTREQLIPLSQEEYARMGGDAAFTTNAQPMYYMLQGDIIRLRPTPNYSSTNGLRVYFDQDISTFASTDTTKTPGFASPFHRMLSVGGALDWAVARQLGKKNDLQNLWNDMEKRLRTFYSQRYKAKFPHNVAPRRDVLRSLT